MRVKWLRTALRELDAQATYIAQDDPDMAAKIYAHIRRRVAMLSNFPESGRPGRVFGARELIIDGYPYIVPYRIRDGILEILRVFHTSRKLPQSWS